MPFKSSRAMTIGPRKDIVELKMKQHFLQCSNSTVVGSFVCYKNICSKLPSVMLVFIFALQVHPVPERISLQVFQVRHFRYNKGEKGCQLRGNIVRKCKASMLSNRTGFKGIETEEGRNVD